MAGRVVVVALFALLSAASARAQTTALYLDSQDGEYVGGGQERTLTLSETVQFSPAGSTRSAVNITIRDSPVWPHTEWQVRLAAPQNGILTPGVYEEAQSHIGAGVVRPGLNVSGDGRSCGGSIGRFQLYEIEFDATSGVLTRFAADFEQQCQYRTAALFGAIRFNSSRSSLNPFDGVYPVYSVTITGAENGFVTAPGIDCGAGRTDCTEEYPRDSSLALHPTASPGYVFLGWAGYDCEGGDSITLLVSRRRFCTPVFAVAPGGSGVESPDYSDAAFYLERRSQTGDLLRKVHLGAELRVAPGASPSWLSFTLGGWPSHPWVGFGAPPGEALAPGVYNHAAYTINWRAQVPTLGFCFEPGGRFQIHEIAFTGSTLTAFAADFETRCTSGEVVAGSVRYRSSHPTLLPFGGAYPAFALEIAPTLGGHVTAAGISCGDGGRPDCRESYLSATAVTVQAVASPGYEFLGWGGACSGVSPTAAVTVNGTVRCLAIFSPSANSTSPTDPVLGQSSLLIQAAGSGTSTQRSLWAWLDSSVRVRHQTWDNTVALTFSSSSAAGAGADLRFRSPVGLLAPGDYDEAYTYANSLIPAFYLSTCTAKRARFRVYEASFGETGNLLAFAADFEALCGNVSPHYVVGAVRFNSSRSTLLPFDGDYPAYKLTVTPAPNGIVTAAGISCGPGGRTDCLETYDAPRVVTLSAAPSPGYKFVGWGADCAGHASTTVTVDWPRRCYAVFNAVVRGLREDPRLAEASLLLETDAIDPIGGGVRRVWTDAEVTAQWQTRNRVSMRVVLPDGGTHDVMLGAPGTDELRAQAYESATNVFWTSGAFLRVPALESAECHTAATGRFVVHELAFASSTSNEVISLAADFEIRCSAGSAPRRGSIRFNSTRATLTPFETAVTPVFRPADFSGDGAPDLVWRHSISGRNAFWFMKGETMASTPPFSAGADVVADLNWEIRAVADMNGDRRGDVIWQHATTGRIAAWLFVGATRTATPTIATLSGASVEQDLDWKVVGAADMNADGHTDLLWRHRVSGALRLWHMNGLEQWDAVDLPLVVADPLWEVAGIADMNGDGWGDIVWRHYGNGRIAAWLMNDAVVLTTLMAPSVVSDTRWRLAGVADVDGDGQADFVWQHTAGGRLAVWYMNALTPVRYASITPDVISDPNWRIVGVR